MGVRSWAEGGLTRGGTLPGVEYYTHHLLKELRARVPEAKGLSAKHRGKTATLGLEESGAWVPLLRLAGGSASFNVMDLWIRRRQGWANTGVRGTPAMLAEALVGELMPFWLHELASAMATKPAQPASDWNGTSETED